MIFVIIAIAQCSSRTWVMLVTGSFYLCVGIGMGPILTLVGGIGAGFYEVAFFIFTFVLDYIGLYNMLQSNHHPFRVKDAGGF